MSEMVGRVAKAVDELNIILDDGMSEAIARAAIAAMRIPTPEMAVTMGGVLTSAGGGGRLPAVVVAVEAYHAGIDKALK